MDPRLDSIDEIDGSPVVFGAASLDAFIVATWELHHADIYAFVACAVRDQDAAEDLLQETFLRLTTEARAGRIPDHVRGWLYRVATNLVISRGRRRTTALNWLTRHGAAEYRSKVGASPEVGHLESERTTAMERAIGRLPADSRAAVLLSGDGFSGQEIAAAIGRSEGATRTLLCRARVAVRRDLAAEDAR